MRRSNRLFNNKKRFIALKVSSNINLNKNKYSLSIISRKSDGIFKQKQKINTSIFVAIVNLIVILQLNMLQRSSRLICKNPYANNKLNTSLVKKS